MITVRVPATSANCSIGFDCLGLALDWKTSISFEPADTLCITGCPPAYQNQDNLVWKAFELACQSAGHSPCGVHIHIDSDIPFARGLGSSSQCIIAGLLGARAMLDLDLDANRLLELGTQLEGHPDNVAPALLGGLCACVCEGESILHIRMEAGGWHVLVVIPPYPLSTASARQVLPESVSLHQAAMQTGRALLFEYAWTHEDERLLASVCQDVLHEPARSALIADYPAMKAKADLLQLPFWISGSGSTMAFVSLDKVRLQSLARQIQKENPLLELRLTRASSLGAQVLESSGHWEAVPVKEKTHHG